MHPAKSIVFFTTASGAGYGYMAALAGIIMARGAILGPAGMFVVLALGFGLIVAGLLASLGHLGHPRRAWMALSQWRSSWLSREGCLAIAFFAPAGLLGLLGLFAPGALGGAVAGLLAALVILLAIATVYSTAMIYASLKAIPSWYSPLVPAGYLLIGLSTGATLLSAVLALAGVPVGALPLAATAATIAALVVKLLHWNTIADAAPVSTARSATGLGGPAASVRLFEAPHTEANYIMKEMGYRLARTHATALRGLAIAVGFVLPLVLLGLVIAAAPGATSTGLLVAAALFALVGAAIERTLFFAEAKHVVTLFYGATAV